MSYGMWGTLRAGVSIAAIMCCCPALAQNGAQGPATEAVNSGVEGDIIVTAQKREERLNDVPISITAATGDQLAKQGISNAEDLGRVVPGFSFTQTSFGAPVFVLRGIGFDDTTIGGAPAVGVYVDQVPLAYSVETRGATLDLERLEVLKGPQGTLFGQSTTGGAINYIAAKPTEETKAGFDLGYGRFNAVQASAFLSGQIAPTLTARIAGRYDHSDGWQKHYLPNDARFGATAGDRQGARKFATGRFLLDWKPSDKATFELAISGWQDDSDTLAQRYIFFAPQSPPSVFNAAAYAALTPLVQPPKDPRYAGWDSNRDLTRNDHFYQISLRGDVTFGDFATLSSITAYSRYKQNALVDYDGSGFQDLLTQDIGYIHSFSQELRLSGDVGGLRWMIGGNYADDESFEDQQGDIRNTNNGVGPFRFNRSNVPNSQKVKTYAGFGSIDVKLTDQLTLQGSARYTKQDRDYRGCLQDAGDGKLSAAFGFLSATLSGTPTVIAPGACVTLNTDPANPVGRFKPLPVVLSSLNQNNFSFRGSLNWKPASDMLVYGSIARGYKPGSYSIVPAVFDTQLDPVTQESVLAYEAGVKTSIGRRLQISAAGFYYDYTNKQLFGNVNVGPPFNNLPKLVNIPKSRVIGGEIEFTLRPLDGLRLSGGVTYTDSKVQRDPPIPLNPLGAPNSYVGEAFPGTPKWQGVLDAEYRFPVGSGTTELFLGGNVSTRSGTWGQFGEFSPTRIAGYTLLDLRGGVELNGGKQRLQIWGRNVTNTFYYNGVRRAADQISGFTGMPATYGVTFSYRY